MSDDNAHSVITVGINYSDCNAVFPVQISPSRAGYPSHPGHRFRDSWPPDRDDHCCQPTWGLVSPMGLVRLLSYSAPPTMLPPGIRCSFTRIPCARRFFLQLGMNSEGQSAYD